jgi:hypothetical protein
MCARVYALRPVGSRRSSSLVSSSLKRPYNGLSASSCTSCLTAGASPPWSITRPNPSFIFEISQFSHPSPVLIFSDTLRVAVPKVALAPRQPTPKTVDSVFLVRSAAGEDRLSGFALRRGGARPDAWGSGLQMLKQHPGPCLLRPHRRAGRGCSNVNHSKLPVDSV